MTEESSQKEKWPFIPIPIPMPVPLSPKEFDQIISRMWPKEYRESLTHLRKARLEVLKAMEAAIKTRVEIMEKHHAEEEPRKEKVQVE
jgi:hypothetical protein